MLTKVANLIITIHDAWKRMMYFGKVATYPHLDIPTMADDLVPIV